LIPGGGVINLYDRGFRVLVRAGNFFFTTVSRPVLGPTQPPVQWASGSLSLGLKRPGREADHSPPSVAEVNKRGAVHPLPQYVFMAWCSVKAKGQLYLYLGFDSRRGLGIFLFTIMSKLTLISI
jgi:hypothetical protein